MIPSKFNAVLASIVPSLIEEIKNRKHISALDAGSLLYNSRLYELLADEETKVWHLSSLSLFIMLQDELKDRKIRIPEELL